jgi:hypothetical protein
MVFAVPARGGGRVKQGVALAARLDLVRDRADGDRRWRHNKAFFFAQAVPGKVMGWGAFSGVGSILQQGRETKPIFGKFC